MNTNQHLSILLVLTLLCSLNFTAKAQKGKTSFYSDGHSFSTALFTKGGSSASTTTVRYTSNIPNGGIQYKNKINETLGIRVFAGLRNIGFIEKENDLTIKRRVYAAPLGVGIILGKIKKTNIEIGGGVDFPFHYKEKNYIKRSDKTKIREWFSDRTPAFMPNAYLQIKSKHGAYIRAQYYPNNFFNTEYTELDAAGNTLQPYKDYKANIINISAGIKVGESTTFTTMAVIVLGALLASAGV